MKQKAVKQIDCTGLDLSSHPQSRPARKKELPVEVFFARSAGRGQTPEGPVSYEAGDAILTGPGGEKWPVKKDYFYRCYRPEPGLECGRDGRYFKESSLVRVLRMLSEFRVHTECGWLFGRPGDWLVQYEPDHYGIISAEVFYLTYELH